MMITLEHNYAKPIYLFHNVSQSSIQQNTSEVIDLLQEYGWTGGEYIFYRM